MTKPLYFISSNNKKISYYRKGNGNTPILVIHGLGFSGNTFLKRININLNNISTYYIDLPGHGNSSSLVLNTEKEWIDLIVEFCISLKSKYIVLIGFSLGGIISLKVSEKLVKQGYKVSLYMWSTPLMVNGKRSSTVFANTLITFGKYLYKLLKLPPTINLLNLFKVDLDIDDYQNVLNTNRYVFKLTKKVFNKDIFNIDERINFKYIYGDRDIYIKYTKVISEIEKICPNSTVYISGSQHFGHRKGWLNTLKYIAENEGKNF